MEIYGFSDQGLPPERVASVALAEITLCATPAELRSMALFLDFCAEEMERMGDEYEHVHLSDRFKKFRNSPHVVVARGAIDT